MQEPVVGTDCGPIRGRCSTSPETGCQYVSFQGVPYARPPVGPLRFKPPEPPEHWTSVRDCLQEGSPCIQHHMWLRDLRGSEDCLYLNVYTPQLPAASNLSRLPVMVFIHGGGFTTGSGGSDLCGPDFLVSEQTVLVTINYRLNVFGFLTTGEPGDAQGNMGLKDQVMALQWVRRNIAAFGGDPGRVTIVGESAGGASVHLHMMSPMSAGLFSQVISQSGVIFNPWAFTAEGRKRAFRLGASLGCSTDDSGKLLEFLRSVSAEELLQNARHALAEEDKEYFCVTCPFPFIPTVEQSDGSVTPFLSEEPLTLLREGRFFKGPVLMGVNSCEGMLTLAAFIGRESEEMMISLNKRLSKLLPHRLQLPRGSSLEKQISNLLCSFYLKGKKAINEDNMSDYLNLLSDVMFLHGFHEAVQLHTKLSSAYIYKFSYAGEANVFKNAIGRSYPGACHADELAYLFLTAISPTWSDLPQDSADVVTRRRMVRMWSNFARTGNPTPDDDALLGVKWIPAMNGKMSYLDIDLSLQNRTGCIAEERMEFLDSLFRKANCKL